MTYKQIAANIYPYSKVKKYMQEQEGACFCNSTSPNYGYCLRDCDNHMSFIQCDETNCFSGKLCRNRPFNQQKARKFEIITTEMKGKGLITLEPINRGQFVIQYVGEVYNIKRGKGYQRYLKNLDDGKLYMMEMGKDLVVDGEKKGNVSRFINHSCDPNCRLQKWIVKGQMRIGIFAIRDICELEQLSYDYQRSFWVATDFQCMCGASNCIAHEQNKMTKIEELYDVSQKTIVKIEQEHLPIVKRGRGRPRKENKNPQFQNQQIKLQQIMDSNTKLLKPLKQQDLELELETKSASRSIIFQQIMTEYRTLLSPFKHFTTKVSVCIGHLVYLRHYFQNLVGMQPLHSQVEWDKQFMEENISNPKLLIEVTLSAQKSIFIRLAKVKILQYYLVIQRCQQLREMLKSEGLFYMLQETINPQISRVFVLGSEIEMNKVKQFVFEAFDMKEQNFEMVAETLQLLYGKVSRNAGNRMKVAPF